MKSILVIEDQPDMLANLTTILRMENYGVLTATTGQQGLDLAMEKNPDLIICDVMMPEMNGHQVLERLRQHRATAATPFIFLTAKGEVRDVRTGMNLGADDYLTKPVTATDLLTCVAARLRRAEQAPPATFAVDFSAAKPLESLNLTPREAEVLLWVAQGKSNADIATILATAEGTVKKHLQHIFDKLHVESRSAATRLALECLAKASPPSG
jgi:DNA-binding NarL/FixJ family response regulator